jgi:hypothetical protein
MGAGGESNVCIYPEQAICLITIIYYRDSASGILNAYYDSVGGRDYILSERRKKKRGHPSSSTGTPDPKTNGSKRARKSEARHPSSTTPPASLKHATFKPPTGSWEDDVQGIDACEGTDGEVMVFLQWSNGQKTQHPLHIVYKRCPQKVRIPLQTNYEYPMLNRARCLNFTRVTCHSPHCPCHQGFH